MTKKQGRPFKVVSSADFIGFMGPDGDRDIGLSVFDGHPDIQFRTLDEHSGEILPAQIQNAHGLILATPTLTRQSLRQCGDFLAVGRFGVGYDSVDVTACTEADVLLFITRGAVDYSMAEATLLWMLALSHHLTVKDRLVRQGLWDQRDLYMGTELRDRTLGLVGCGGIGRSVVQLCGGFGMKQPLVYDPHLTPREAKQPGVRTVGLDELLASSDFVSVHCPLTDETRNLIGAREIALMKPTTYLINTARGGIIDEDALFDALVSRQIAGAALDCFVGEPLAAPPRYAGLDNVLLAPHCIGWTHELFRDMGIMACQGMVDLFLGNPPRTVINPEVMDRPGVKAKWARVRGVTA